MLLIRTTKQTIEVPGLLEGWKAVSHRVPNINEYFIFQGSIQKSYKEMMYPYLIVEKIQPRRIVLEETNEVRKVNRYDWAEIDGVVSSWNSPSTLACEYKVWREVKETDIPLTKCEPNVKMTIDDARDYLAGLMKPEFSNYIKNHLAGDFAVHISKFIKENS